MNVRWGSSSEKYIVLESEWNSFPAEKRFAYTENRVWRLNQSEKSVHSFIRSQGEQQSVMSVKRRRHENLLFLNSPLRKKFSPEAEVKESFSKMYERS